MNIVASFIDIIINRLCLTDKISNILQQIANLSLQVQIYDLAVY